MQDTVPLPVAFCLYTAICQRYDLQPKGPTYAEQEMIAAMEKVAAERLSKPQAKRKRKTHE